MMYTIRGIILKRVPWRENDRQFSIYSYEQGKMEAVARGTQKIKSKLAAHLEPFLISQITVVRGRNFDQITAASTERAFKSLKTDLGKIYQASFCLEIVDILTKPQVKEEKFFDLLTEILELLDKVPASFETQLALSRLFSLKFLAGLGYTPELYHCLHCGQKISLNNHFFNALKGGLVCQKHKTQEVTAISVEAVEVLRLILTEPLAEFLKIKASADLLKEVSEILTQYLRVHLEQPLRSEIKLSF